MHLPAGESENEAAGRTTLHLSRDVVLVVCAEARVHVWRVRMHVRVNMLNACAPCAFDVHLQ